MHKIKKTNKKIYSTIIAALLALILCLFTGSSYVKGLSNTEAAEINNDSKKSSQGISEFFTAEIMDNKLKELLGITAELPDGDVGARQMYTDGERNMAAKINNLVNGINLKKPEPVYNIELQPVSEGDNNSQNLIIRKSGRNPENRKQVILGSNYDSYTSINNTDKKLNEITESLGASESGTSCALLLTLMEYFAGVDVEFDLVFVFFGAGNSYKGGAYSYVNNFMTGEEKDNTLLFAGFRRFGGDKVYLYSEEVKTEHENYLLKTSSSLNLSINKIGKNSLPVIQAQAVDRLPYANWAMIGPHAPFMNSHINVASFHTANYSTLNTSDIESKSRNNVVGTTNDTYTTLKMNNPQFSNQMAEVAALVSTVITDGDFESVMLKSISSYKNYDWATKSFIANIILIVIMILMAVAVIIVSKLLEKKYPKSEVKHKRIKLAVFGREYEAKDGDDIFIDIKRPEDNNPFEGF